VWLLGNCFAVARVFWVVARSFCYAFTRVLCWLHGHCFMFARTVLGFWVVVKMLQSLRCFVWIPGCCWGVLGEVARALLCGC